MTTREYLHQLVNGLTDQDLEAAQRLLEYLRSEHDPIVRSLLTAVADDEPETSGERCTAAEAQAAYDAGDWISLDQMRREICQ